MLYYRRQEATLFYNLSELRIMFVVLFPGAFSRAMYGDSSVLLQDPDRVADTWLNFASALWYTPI